MPLRKILSLACLILMLLCMAIGYITVGGWIALATALITLLVWLPIYKWPSSWLPAIALVISAGLAAIGLCVGATPALMLPAATLALALWDLANLNQARAGGPSDRGVSLLEKKNFQSLALALGLALLAIIAGRLVGFQIPFGGMILLVLLAFFGFGRFWRLLSR